MRFEFCGNVDCPEWALAEVSLLNRISAIKLKLILVQIVKKISGQPFDNDKIIKLCRDQKFDTEETKVFIAVIEFLLRQATKHQVSDKVFSKDLLQMGVAIENASALVKVLAEQQDSLTRALKQDSLRISQIQGVQYSVSYIMATSSSGTDASEQGIQPLDAAVSMNIEVRENPKTEIKFESAEPVEQKTAKVVQIGFSMSRDKFFQFAKDMKHAVNLLQITQKIAQEL